MSEMTMGKRIKKLRLDAGLSQRALSIAADIRQASLSALERGTQTWMRDDALVRLADTLGVDPTWLRYGGKEPSEVRAKVIDTMLQSIIEDYNKLSLKDRKMMWKFMKVLRKQSKP